MNIHVGDEIELTEEVVPENTAEKLSLIHISEPTRH